MTTAARRTVNGLIGAYLAQLAGGKRRVRQVEGSLDLLRQGLNGSGYQNLPVADRERWSVRGAAPAYEEVVDDYLVIERVAPGRIWFLGGVGPITVPEAASAVARPGWTVSIAIGRRGADWDVLEVGSVYPETLA